MDCLIVVEGLPSLSPPLSLPSLLLLSLLFYDEEGDTLDQFHVDKYRMDLLPTVTVELAFTLLLLVWEKLLDGAHDDVVVKMSCNGTRAGATRDAA